MTGVSNDVDARLHEVVTASQWLAATAIAERADILREIADDLEERAPEIVAVAAEESLLPLDRLRGEQTRTVNQFRLYADVIEEGSWLQASITHELSSTSPLVQDHRRVNVALGPVIVFAASNFPLAFGIVGTDTASALAAGCAVVAKGHPGHPRLAALLAGLIQDSLARQGVPDAVFTLVNGDDAVTVLSDARITAGAFTGSIGGGTALKRIADSRDVPIPFYAEMGSVNPVIVTAAAWRTRRAEILSGLVDSMTVSNGQLCTSPGVLFVPDAELSPDELAAFTRDTSAGTLLTDSIADGYRAGVRGLAKISGVEVAGTLNVTEGRSAQPVLWVTDASSVEASPNALKERFGPSSLVVRYDAQAEVLHVLAGMDGQLTASIFAEPEEEIGALVQALADKAGRILLNAWPTGVAVSWSMHHGGPWPASSSVQFGSVGAEAIDRFTRPVTYQNFDDRLLPMPLREENPWRIPRRVDGVLTRLGA